MKKLISLLLICLTTYAGNGVERGRVILTGQFNIQKEIRSYLSKELTKCSLGLTQERFDIKNIAITKDEVDQGITDFYYKIELTHFDNIGNNLNDIKIEIEDADYSNWRRYEEKLSIQLLSDVRGNCNL
ncbi:hypothetical protein M902_0906 [Bacteriovorax sp. BAL6_X]|uniref:hypothetical protein n=1 Tax=Bacteriovorax sp. BAL6_X TaxID=1201290 RepID=UPI0003867FAA|nr:hypothetical protein [Bacteriovorax sp. BAL6_X]EPZ49600.1 hypothetical protein M902_0906 [Bacteriovorax sp. BAL6_X]